MREFINLGMDQLSIFWYKFSEILNIISTAMLYITSQTYFCSMLPQSSQVSGDDFSLKKIQSQALVTHTCNPGYSGGTDQEDRSSKPAQANSVGDPISKISSTKQGWRSGSRCRP
jgi:hypothetical protein